MKQRVISGVFIAAIYVAVVYFNGILMNAFVAFLAIQSSFELISVKGNKFNHVLFAVTVLSIFGYICLWGYQMQVALIETLALFTIGVFDENESLKSNLDSMENNKGQYENQIEKLKNHINMLQNQNNCLKLDFPFLFQIIHLSFQ